MQRARAGTLLIRQSASLAAGEGDPKVTPGLLCLGLQLACVTPWQPLATLVARPPYLPRGREAGEQG